MAIEIKNRIFAETEVNVPIVHFLSGASIESLANYALTELQLQRISMAVDEPVAPSEEEFAL